MALFRPIFIIGTGRSGTSVFQEMFTRHPHVAFLSGLCIRFPHQPWVNRWAMHLMDVPFLHRIARKKFRPAEHWPFWETRCRGFSLPFRDLLASDVRPGVKARIANDLKQMVTPRRNRLLVKLTGWPRIGFLSEIFPDAVFINLIRDGRAVANSLLDTDFWRRYGGPQHWQWGDLTPEQQDEWDQSGKSFVTLAGIQWKILMEAFAKARDLVPSTRYLEVKYEDLVADPKAVFDRALTFCELAHSREFEAAIESFNVVDRNQEYKTRLTHFQRKQLGTVLADHLGRWGYTSD
jgi:hypothetical protein